jgi:hypothetical protein
MPQPDDHDELAALDFHGTDEPDHHAGVESDALDFTAAEDDDAEQSAVDALDDYAPAEPEDTETGLEAIDSVTEPTEEQEQEEEDGVALFTVANPSDTVSVSALMDGRTHRVELSPRVAKMTESELAEEILVLAELAQQKGLAGQHTYLIQNASQSEGLQGLSEIGLDGSEVLRQFMETGMQLPTPEQAAEAQAEVFATRYGTSGA